MKKRMENAVLTVFPSCKSIGAGYINRNADLQRYSLEREKTMCGIAGIINHHADPGVKTLLFNMNRSQEHRGPDGSGTFVDEDVAFAHRRLAIIDPEGGGQPMTSEDGSVVVMLNGEIYNYKPLRKKLIERGHSFRSDSDTEVLVHLYEELGSECTAMLDGMFAFAVYNRRTRRVLLARDRMGKKPLLYFMTGSTLVFASEFQALRCHPAMPREPDMNALSDFLSLHYIAAPDTAYRNVRKLLPAHQLEFRLGDGTVSIRGYWRCDYAEKSELPFDDAAHELRSLVEKAVEKRLMADVPSGAFLSGGIDSAIVTALMTKLRGDDPTDAFTVGFADSAYDERAAARKTAAAINRANGGRLRHHEELAEANDFAVFEKLAGHFGEPFGDASMIPTFLVSRFAKGKIGMALSGDGADEVFGGYERYQAMRFASHLDALSPAFLRKFAGWSGALLLPDAGERTFSGRLRRMLRLIGTDPERRYFSVFDHAPAARRTALLGERFRAVRDPFEVFSSRFWELTSSDPGERLGELDLHTYLVGDILTKLDISSMAASLEVRSPFLDREVVEFAARLPMPYKLGGGERKHILKAAFADMLPPEQLRRPKKGFGVPVARWLRRDWRNLAHEALFDSPLVPDGFCRGEALERLWSEHLSERRDHSYLLWGLLNLGLFLERENAQ